MEPVLRRLRTSLKKRRLWDRSAKVNKVEFYWLRFLEKVRMYKRLRKMIAKAN